MHESRGAIASCPRRRVSNGGRRRAARGGAAIGTIVMLVIFQMIVVSMVASGARDQDLSVQRMDAARAFYVCEGGANMAIREVISGSDCDGDGVVGGISAKSIGVATVAVSASGSGSVQLLSTGSSGICRSKASVSITGAGAGSGGSLTVVPIVYADNTSIPKSRYWDGTSWSTQSSGAASGNVIRTALVSICPSRSEWLGGGDSAAGGPYGSVWNGTAWGSSTQLASAGLTYRPFYVAYELLSGDGMAVYDSGGAGEPHYSTWNGSAWSTSLATSVSSNDSPSFCKLVPRPNSNEIMLLCLDSNTTLKASVWSGSAWTNTSLMSNSVSHNDTEACDAAYEGLSGRCMVCWGGGGCKLWDGAAWSAGPAPPNTTGSTKWVRLAADPASNLIASLTLDGQSNLKISMWNGSSWTASVIWIPNAANVDRRNYDIAFEPGGTRALAVYTKSANTPFYRTWDGAAWSAELTGPNIGSPSNYIQVKPGLADHEILIGCYRRSDNGLSAMRWDGASLGGAQTLTSTMGTAATYEPFMLGAHVQITSNPEVVAWTMAEP